MNWSNLLIAVGVIISFVCMLVGFDIVHADLGSHWLGWGFLSVFLIGVGVLIA